jgi:hypothetical protein
MDKTELLTVFRCMVPLTWLLYVPAFAMAMTGKGAARAAVTLVLLASMAALAWVTLDAARSGIVW